VKTHRQKRGATPLDKANTAERFIELMEKREEKAMSELLLSEIRFQFRFYRSPAESQIEPKLEEGKGKSSLMIAITGAWLFESEIVDGFVAFGDAPNHEDELVMETLSVT
jgi:hypothetical protein